MSKCHFRRSVATGVADARTEFKGGGDRTRVSTDETFLIDNDLRIRIERLAALWLRSAVTDCHEVARIVTIAENLSLLDEPNKK